MTDLALPPATAQPEDPAAASAPSKSTGEQSPVAAPTAAAGAATSTVPFYIPSYMTGGDPTIAEKLANIDWEAEFKKLMELTGQMIDRQLNGQNGDERPAVSSGGASAGHGSEATRALGDAKPSGPNSVGASPAAASSLIPLTYANAVKSSTAAARKSGTLGVASTSATAAANMVDMEDDSASATATSKTGAGKHHWKKLTKAQQRHEQSQRNAFEAFANALLHSVSPFMAPLRAKCKTSLPHIKVDQRFGKSGHPETAIAQFLVAPLVTNYRPRHFHDVAPGELMEFHYDFALVLQAIRSAHAIHIGYGSTWKRYAVPYCYLACREYRKEVLALCPEEIPNSRSEAIYEDDVVKDITELLLKRGEGLEMLETMSIVEAMRKRVDLYPLYDAFATLFQNLENYQVEISDIRSVPSRFLLKTSRLAVEAMPQPIVLDDEVAWDGLPEVSRVLVEGGVATSGAAGSEADGGTARLASKQKALSTLAPVAAATGAVSGKRGAALAVPPAASGTTSSWQTLAPLIVSVACVTATIAVVLIKKRR
ncbi:hypothetical protein LPMP_261830 [Leishmania panamensis]|uniref:Transmembrane protein n=2 Tax=Leishmania guyanensis species complex TaxID=38579 RepID=A0A088RTR4_LEIPA|nr:hypothetical protein LPMP_261830 [Leishmania panamensis]AIN99295.1 hypothetical protein LPMP_261830 [Leishmania panamensis]